MKYFVSVVNNKDAGQLYFRVEDVEKNTLRQLQENVGGYIDVANWIFPDLCECGYDCIIAEDAIGKPLTLVHYKDNHKYPIHGNIVFAKHDEDGETIGLSEEECLRVMEYIMKTAGDVMPIIVQTSSKQAAMMWQTIAEMLNEDEEKIAKA